MTTTTLPKGENVMTLCLTTGPIAVAVTETLSTNSKKKSNNNNTTTGTSSRREIVHFHKTRATVKDLYLRAEDLFDTDFAAAAAAAVASATAAATTAGSANKKKSTKTKNNSSITTTSASAKVVMVLERRTGGFPPKLQRLDRNSDQTLQQAGIENQERITVSFITPEESPVIVESSSMKTAASGAAKSKGKKEPILEKKSSTTENVGAEVATSLSTTDEKKAVRQSKKTNHNKDDDDNDEGNDEASSCCSVQAEEEENQDNSTTTTTTTTMSARPKRAAAQKATESFAVTMAAQDALVRQQEQSLSNKKRRASPAAPSNNKKKAAVSTTTTNHRFTANRTSTGRRLQDGAVVSRPSPPRQPRRRHRAGNEDMMVGDDNDPQAKAGMALLGALNGGADASSSGARLMRQGWRKAVLDAYEQNQATARLAAVASANTTTVVQFQCWKPARDHSASLVAVSADASAVLTEDEQGDQDAAEIRRANWQLNVQYPKGVQGRGNFEERVDYIPYVALKNVTRSICPVNPEALRPENLALLSPRIFWSLLYHWQRRRRQTQPNDDGTTATNNNTNAIHEAFMTMHPDLDWSFLRRRKQQLSEKALENLRQQQHAQHGESNKNSSVGQDYEAAAAAIAAVEQAMQGSTTHVDPSQRQARMLQAAQRRAAAAAGGTHAAAAAAVHENDAVDNAIIVTPTETDEDELKACVLAGITSREDDEEEAAKDENADITDDDWDKAVISIEKSDGGRHMYTVRSMVEALIQNCDIHNWRQLANSKGADVLVQQLFTVNAASKASDDDEDGDALIDMVQAWIDHAREESLDEIMVEICQGQIDAVQLLDRVKAATPKDLALWTWIVDDLYKVLQVEAATAASAEKDEMDTTEPEDDTAAPEMMSVPTKQDLQQWCQRAQWALEQWEWLADYVTPIA